MIDFPKQRQAFKIDFNPVSTFYLVAHNWLKSLLTAYFDLNLSNGVKKKKYQQTCCQMILPLREDIGSTRVFLLYWQLSQGQMANITAFIATKSFDLYETIDHWRTLWTYGEQKIRMHPQKICHLIVMLTTTSFLLTS